MAQFNFGSNLGGNTTAPGFSFGATKPAAPAFGAPQTQPSGSITFGTPIASTAQTAPNTGLPLGAGLNFGTPVLSTPATGLSFGSPKPAAFGTPTSQPALNFGASASQPGLNFGAPTSQPGLNFGATAPIAAVAPTLAFGAATTSSAAAPGLNFGAPTATSAGLSFGAPTSAGFGLGVTPTSTATAQNPLGGINFGTPTSTSNPNPLGGINFGTPAASTGFSLGTATSASATPGLSFGAAPAATPASTGLSFGLGGSTATSVAPTLNFKSSFTPAITPAASTGLNFGFNPPPAKTQATTALLLTTPSASSRIGLGGVDSSQNKIGIATAGQASNTITAKENQVPNEILQSIEHFKQFVKDQKTQSSDVSRGSARPFVKVREDIDLINTILTDVGNDLQRNQQLADKLKHDSARCLHNAEMAQRTNDTPPGLQFENTAPLRYFIELVNQFEQDLQALRAQIDVTDKHFHSLHEPKFLTSQELATGMRRLHDTFVALAGRLHSVHTQVESHKEQYLNLRKYILKDPTNIFVKPASKEEEALDVALRGLGTNKLMSGPTPFSSFGSPFGINVIPNQQITAKPPPAYPTTTAPLNFETNASGQQTWRPVLLSLEHRNSSLLFGSTSTLSPQATQNSGFQLQSPPPGNKRGKR